MYKMYSLVFLMMISHVLQATPNYIKVHYNLDKIIQYTYGWYNQYRSIDDVDHFRTTYNIQKDGVIPLDPNYGQDLEIHFNKAIRTLESYFDTDYDSFADYIESVDFTNFDSSEVTSLAYLFGGVKKLKYVNFKNFKSSKLTTLSYMFDSCTALSSIDLSYLDTSNVNGFKGLFKGCSNLRLINITGFNFDKDIIDMDDAFSGLNSLRYIDLTRVSTGTLSSASFRQSPLQSKAKLIVCQSSNILGDEGDLIFFCCNFNVETNMCKPTEYSIKVFYSKIVDYLGGFGNNYREGIYFINYQGNSYAKNSNLNIAGNNGALEIYFSAPVTNLNNFFDSNVDSNGISIISIDLSKINSPNLINMEFTFRNCVSLNSIQFPNNYRFPLNSMKFIFSNCKSLISINLLSLNTASVSSMDSIFDECSSLVSIDLSSFNTAQVTEINNMFKGCTNLVSIDLSSFNTEKVSNMDSLFNGCSNLVSINLSSFNTEKVSNMNSMFKGCTNLVSIDLSSFNTEKVSNMDSMFYECNNLVSLNLSSFNTASLSEINYMFYNCFNLVCLEIKNFNMENVNQLIDAFYQLNKLRYLDIYNIRAKKDFINGNYLNQIDNLFVCQKNEIITNPSSKTICCHYDSEKMNCISINYIIVTYGKDTTYENGFKNEFRKGISFIKYGETTLTTSEKLTIAKNTNIEINFPTSTEVLSHLLDVDYDSLAANIVSIDFSHLDASSINDMSFFFKGLKLKSIDLSTLDLSSLKNMASMFENCDSLEEIKFPANSLDNLNDINSLFSGCSSLISVDLSIFNTASVTNMNSLFKGCSSMELINIPDFITSSVTDMSLMFSGCTNLQNINIDNFNMEKVESADNMFNEVNNLKYISIYYVEHTNKYITDSNLKNINKLIVCQKDNIIKNDDAINVCCYFDHTKGECISSNYIEISFAEKVEYENGFGRDGIEFMINGDYSQKRVSDKLSILPNTKLKLFMSNTITNLGSFFGKDKDDNVDKINFIDFSRFDKSKITNIASLFYGCKSLKQIDLSDFNTSSITNMDHLFSDCESLEIIDLTYFNTSLVNNMNKMFNNCKSLKILEISYFDMSKVESSIDMFTSVDQLKYINIYNIIDPKNIIKDSDLQGMDNNLKVCQRNDILSNKNNICCFYDLTNDNCANDNYMIIYFGENTIYNSGFKNKNREGISFIKNSLDHERTIGPNGFLNIKEGTKIEIYFSKESKSLTEFFSNIDDKNVEKITFIDLSHFDSSLVTMMNFMFYHCTSLTSIDFTNLNTSLVKYMNYMFSGCSSLISIANMNFDTSLVMDMKYMFSDCKSLKSIDLSYFNTPSLIDMEHLFSNCASLEIIDLSYFNTTLVNNMNSLFFKCYQLKVIDISNFDMKKVQYGSDIFTYATSLKYINLNHITDSYELITNSDLKEIKGLTVCQDEEIIQNQDVNNMCCHYDIENEKCDMTNSILIYYGIDAEYNSGFQTDYRKNIEYLINVDYKKKIKVNETFKVHKGAKLEIYFNSNEIELNNFFQEKYTANIISIDFSYFHSTSLISLNSLFSGCTSLISLDLSNLDTSSVTDMSYMFYRCSSLKSLEIYNFNTTSVKSMGYMFYECTSLESLDLSNFYTPLITEISSMFDTCGSLQFLDISHFNLKSVSNYELFLKDTSKLKYFNIYHVQHYGNVFETSYANQIYNLTVCQKENIITNKDANNECGHFNYEINKCDSHNYIIIRYGEKTKYNFGFIKDSNNKSNEYRKNIDFIIITHPYNKINKLKDTDKLVIKKGSTIEIYFSSPLNSLEKFFDAEIDINMKNAILIDLSHFDMSLVTNMNNLFSNCVSLKKIYLPEKEIKLKDQMIQIFYECNSLESIDLSYFDTSTVTDMSKLFYNCNSIKNLDLSSFNTNSAINMSEMFYGCTSLNILEITNFNMEKLKENKNMFEGLDNLLYINIYDVKNTYLNITNSVLNKKDNLTVCQKENLITNKNIIRECCFIDKETNECDSNNFIILYYKEDYIYESGFNENNKRNDIKYIINGSKRDKLNSDEKLVIKSGTKIEIYYNSPIQTLENYFSINYDANGDKIEQIDLLNFDSSLVTDMSSMLLGCSSLKSVDLSNFDTSSTIKMNFMFFGCNSLQIINLTSFKTSLVKNMNYMFYGCSSLKSLILPQLDTSSVVNMNSMFSGCSSLKSLDLSSFKTSLVINMNYMFYDLSSLEYLNISNFDMRNIKYADNIFTGLNKLKYIDIYNVQNENKYISESDLNKNNKLEVCQKDIIIKDKTTKCEIEHTDTVKEDNNYIIVEYGAQTNYPIGFIYNGNANNDYRKDIAIKLIIKEKDQSKYNVDQELNIEPRERIQIHFTNPVTTFTSFFDSTYDNNTKNIEFIDFSNFISSSVTDISSLLKGCTSLKAINMTNFDFKNIEQSSSLFSDANNLKYIILNDIKNYDENKMNLAQELNVIETLIVCQKDEIIKNENYKYKCCNYNIKKEYCEYENSIVIKFSAETEYPNGFSYETFGNINGYRNDNNFTIYLNDKKYEANEQLVIPKDSIIVLQFESNVKSLKFFFYRDYDENVENIISVDISQLNLSSVTDMSYMFSGCFNLENIDFSNKNAPLLTDISFIFSGCSLLKSVDLTNFKTPSLISMNSMFSDCGNLKTIDLYNINTSLVTNMNKLFYGCSSLILFDASDLDTSSVTDMNLIFGGCSNLKYIDISNFNFKNIQSAENMFNGDSSLSYINIYNVERSYSDIIKNNLKNYDELTVCQKNEIIIGDKINNQCCYFNLERGECDKSKDVETGKSILYTNYIIMRYGKDVEYNSGFITDTYNGEVNEYRNAIEFIIYKDYTTKIKRADKLIISANTKMEIYLSSSLKNIQSFFSSNYDYNVESIISIDLSHLDTSLIENMDSLFLGCISLESIDLNDKDLSNAKNMNLMFLGCNSLHSIILPNETISNIEKMNSIFLECSSLKSIDLSNLNTTSLTNMGKMFYRCQSLSSIDLSEFDTSLVIDMNEMFYKCDSLLYLDISNFDMANTKSYDKMILANNKIKFINLYNFKNDKIIAEIFKKKKNFYVCQKELIITNPRAYNCCDYNFEIDDCEYSIPRQITSDLQIIIETTEGELIDTVPDEPTTQYTEKESTTELPNTHKPIPPPTIKPETNIHIEPTTEKVKSTILKTDTVINTIVPTTIYYKIATTIPKINPKTIIETTIPITSKTEIKLVLFGFNNFIMQPSWFSFLIYFISLTNSVYPENLIMPITIINNNSLRILSNIEGKCTLQGSGTEVKGQYLCEVEADTSNINQIKIGNDFKFDSEDNVTVSGITPIANMYMDNIQDIGNKFANLDNSTIYVLEHSVYKKYGNLLFNITGMINDPQPNITDDNFALIMNSASNDKTQIEANCNIADIIGNNYTLNCKSNENIEGDLQSAISFIDDDIIIINFDESTDSEINIETNSTSLSGSGRFSRKKSGGLNAGAIVGIILALVIAIISIIAVMIYCKKENHNKHEINESTIIKINGPKVDSTKI